MDTIFVAARDTVMLVSDPMQQIISNGIAVLNVFAVVLAVVFTARAARAAERATEISADMAEQDRAARRTAISEAYYRVLVMDPSLREIPQFFTDAAALFTDTFQVLDGLNTAEQTEMWDDAAARMMDEFQARYDGFRSRIRTGALYWGDQQLLAEVEGSLDQIEDVCTEQLEKVLGGAGSRTSLFDSLAGTQNTLITALRRYHPLRRPSTE